MNMKIVKREEKRLCPCCMEEHEIETVLVKEHTIFKEVDVCYDGLYYYCKAAEELYMDEEKMRENHNRLKEAYREKVELLASKQSAKASAEE